MLRRSILLVLLVAVCCINPNVGAQIPSAHSKADQRIRCTIWLDNKLLSKGTVATVHVALQNASSEKILIVGMTGHLRAKQKPAWDKREEEYWSPVDLKTKSALRAVRNSKGGWEYPETTLELKAKSESEFTLNLATLEWANEIWSGLPSLHLYGAVPKGHYELSFDLEVRDAVEIRGCSKTDIEIRGAE